MRLNFRLIRLIPLLYIAFVMDACQSARELHYFKSGGNYYRLRINESSVASKSRYLSGYFDEAAVDKYFSEMSQPKDTVKWLSSTAKNAQLVMILSTNSNSVAEQIGNLANNEQLLENVAMLANKDKITRGNEFSSRLSELDKTLSNIKTAGDAYIESADSSDAVNSILDFLSNLKVTTSGHLDLKNIETAINKLNQ